MVVILHHVYNSIAFQTFVGFFKGSASLDFFLLEFGSGIIYLFIF